ncbi:YqcI/YcgG family protein [Thiosulfativibrio zosterae]|uniref:DUF3396 domain-containing protein n=1 Tax=Thiosulfativibrio zosterae TaxID=2675053 RepID=A0A6F8PNM9_9GAMM|nr:YqcI/YcgG family protein [Thiosulfativibrio zosterae]BBP43722.1 hypothetical protein THMIRHAT_14680 [Thiosulfativibrio zosterae]
MNLLKQFTLGQRRALTFATDTHTQLNDQKTIELIDFILKSNLALPNTQACLSFVILQTAYRYYAFSERLLNQIEKPEMAQSYSLEQLPKHLKALQNTLGFYQHISVQAHLPENNLVSVQSCTNQLFAIFALHFKPQLLDLETHWQKALSLLIPFSRDELIYEPAFSATHLEFMKAVDETQCIFAPTGKYWGANEWDETLSFQSNVEGFSQDFFRFMSLAKKEGFKGFAVRFPASYSASLETLSQTVAQFFQAMNQVDPAQSACLKNNITEPGWKFTWANEPMFLTAFGTCYPLKHPRNPYGFNHTYFFFQPDFVLRKHPGLTDGKEQQSRERILQNFTRNDMAYDNQGKELEVQRYIRPMQATDPAVNWWQYLV